MVYYMKFYVDGGCRRNGRSNAIGAAAACMEVASGANHYVQTRKLQNRYRDPTPTNQRAEITAIILALEWALERYDELDGYPRLNVEIKSDSRYAVGCMNRWIYQWSKTGWINSKGVEVVNRDLIEHASDLDDQAAELGSVKYTWVPRDENQDADGYCNKLLDEME